IVIGYPCFRLKVVGHYFALVTLALAEVARLSIVAARDITGGSLGMTPNGVPTPSWYAIQFADKRYFYFLALALWLFGLWIWRRARGDLGGRGGGGRDRDPRHAPEAHHHHHQRGHDRARRRALRPVRDVPQSRYVGGRRRVASDRVRGDRRRHVLHAWPHRRS